MKRKKEIEALQLKARTGMTWPNATEQDAFDRFKSTLRNLVFENLTSLPYASTAAKTWDYDPYEETFYFTVREMLAIEVKSEMTVRSQVEQTFNLHRSAVTTDVALAIEMLNTEIEQWRAGLGEMRKLQLGRVLQNEGQEAYAAAVDRGM